MEIEERLRILEEATFGKSGDFWHSVWEEDGVWYGKIGAMTHVVTPESHLPMTPGYHTIEKRGIGHFIGQVGSRMTHFHLSSI